MAYKKKSNTTPLIVEKLPEDYNGHPFITLIQHRSQNYLTIVDNSDSKAIKAYVLDLCGPEGVDEELIINTASNWYYTHKQRYPISVEFSKKGLSDVANKIYRTYYIEYVARVIGTLPHYDMSTIHSTKRRRKKSIPAGTEIKKKLLVF